MLRLVSTGKPSVSRHTPKVLDSALSGRLKVRSNVCAATAKVDPATGQIATSRGGALNVGEQLTAATALIAADRDIKRLSMRVSTCGVT